MLYEEFKSIVSQKSKLPIENIEFEERSGYYFAYIGEGVTITAKPSSKSLTVCWGAASESSIPMYRGRHNAQIPI